MSVILECSECGMLQQPNRPKTIGEPCYDAKCSGKFQMSQEQVEQPEDPVPPHSPEQPEMFPQPKINPVLFTRDNLKAMVDAADKKVKTAKIRYDDAIEDWQRKSIMLATIENINK